MSTAAMLKIYHSNRLETLADALALVTERPVPGRADRGAKSRVNTLLDKRGILSMNGANRGLM